MIWATVSSQSCFCWLYRDSPSLAAKNMINMCFWKRVFAMTSAFSWQNSISFCPPSFCTPRPNLPVTSGVWMVWDWMFRCWMVCLGNKQRSFCRFWECLQVLHIGFFCWLWWLLHFFYVKHKSKNNTQLWLELVIEARFDAIIKKTTTKKLQTKYIQTHLFSGKSHLGEWHCFQ